jgi:hypothetical protein
MYPVYNNPGINYAQPIATNNAMNGVPVSNDIQNLPTNNVMQCVPMVSTQIPQYYNLQSTNQPPQWDNNSQPQQQQQYYTNQTTSLMQQPTKPIQHHYSMSSTSDDEQTNQDTTENPWQRVQSTKRRKIRSNNNATIPLTNRYSMLTMDTDETTKGAQQEGIHPKPPPIFIYGVTNYQQMKNKIREIVEDEQYNTKTLADNTIKINPNTPETYRKMIKFMREERIIHHTYQLKKRGPFE